MPDTTSVLAPCAVLMLIVITALTAVSPSCQQTFCGNLAAGIWLMCQNSPKEQEGGDIIAAVEGKCGWWMLWVGQQCCWGKAFSSLCFYSFKIKIANPEVLAKSVLFLMGDHWIIHPAWSRLSSLAPLVLNPMRLSVKSFGQKGFFPRFRVCLSVGWSHLMGSASPAEKSRKSTAIVAVCAFRRGQWGAEPQLQAQPGRGVSCTH